MSWAVFKDGKKVGKNFPTKEQSIIEAIENGHVLFSKSQRWFAEGVEIKLTNGEPEKDFDFLVREDLTRDRIYTIRATSELEARHLLDGFRQQPIETAPADEKITINDYHILSVSEN